MKKDYRVNARHNYEIEYRAQSDGTIKLYAPTHPTDPHGGSVHESHLYSTGEICVAKGHEPRTMDRAMAIAVHWMDGHSEYVRTGKFPNGPRRVKV